MRRIPALPDSLLPCAFLALQSGYSTYLATQLESAKWSTKSKAELFVLGPKKLEGEYGNCLRSIVNKN